MAAPNFVRRFVEMMRSGEMGQIRGVDMTRGTPVDIVLSTMPSGSGPDLMKMSPEQLWASQPHLRTVVDFIATSIAGLGLHAFEIDGEERKRLRGAPINEWLRRPNRDQTMAEFIEQLTGELTLNDVAWVWVYESDHRAMRETRVIPSKWVSTVENAFGIVKEVRFQDPNDDGKTVSVPAEQMCRFVSWAAGRCSGGVSRVNTLKIILAEQYSAWQERYQMSKRKGRFGGFFTRPKDAGPWDDDGRRRFIRMTRDYTSDSGPRAGEDMLLEDGITYTRASRSAHESQWAESVQLSLVTCAQVFHVNPVMVGVLDNANYSNAREFRSALYTDTLGPIILKLEGRLNAFLLEMLGVNPDEVFLEFNVDAKLRGSFSDRASIMSKAAGGPWMTRNEIRKLDNLPPLEGGDELIVPANVLIGGLASPEDGGEGRPPDEKATTAMVEIATEWAARMDRSTAAKRNSGTPNWWHPMRWRRELEDDLLKANIEPALAAWFASRCVEWADGAVKSGVVDFDPVGILEGS